MPPPPGSRRGMIRQKLVEKLNPRPFPSPHGKASVRG
jgi:hypothetical protein